MKYNINISLDSKSIILFYTTYVNYLNNNFLVEKMNNKTKAKAK